MTKTEHHHDEKSSHKIIKKAPSSFGQDTMMMLTTLAVVFTCVALVVGVAIGLNKMNQDVKSINTAISSQASAQSKANLDLTNQIDTLTAKVGSGTTAAAADPAPAVKVDLATIKGLFTKDSISFGNNSAKLIFVDVSDPSCPYCHVGAGKNPELAKQIGAKFAYDTDGGSYQPPVREMKKLVDSGKASFVTIYSNGHGNGEMAMQALYCAQEKNKFWEAHDLLYSNAGYDLINQTVKNDVTKAPELSTFLASAVDSSFMKDCLATGKYKAMLAKNVTTSQSLGVNGTPGFFVNTTNFAGAYSFADMKTAVDAAMK
jgi:protein-disulfide isomerase